MRLAYVLLWSLYVYQVSPNIYEHKQPYFLCLFTSSPQQYERVYILFMKVESDLKHPSLDATHLSHKIDKHSKMSYNTPHFTATINALHKNYKLECAAVHITLKCSTTTLKVIRCTD